MIEVQFTAQMKKAFLTSDINKDISQKVAKFLAISGGSVMTTARRLLKRKASKSMAELTDDERTSFLRWQKRYRDGKTEFKPRKPDKTSPKGQPPRLHSKDSVLKNRLFWAVTEDKKGVVVGPELFTTKPNALAPYPGLKGVQALERNNPFMSPALNKIIPRIPSYLAKASKG